MIRNEINLYNLSGSKQSQALPNYYNSMMEYINRILTDGGEIRDYSTVLRDFDLIYNSGYYSLYRDLWSYKYGLKKDGSNNVSKLYGLLGYNFEQTTLANQPNLTADGITANGTTDYLQIPTDPTAFKITNSLIISAWVKVATAGSNPETLLAKNNTVGNNRAYSLYLRNSAQTDNKFRFYATISADGNITNYKAFSHSTLDQLTDGSVYHVVVGLKTNVPFMYINKNSQSLFYNVNGTVNTIFNTTAKLTMFATSEPELYSDSSILSCQVLEGDVSQGLVNHLYELGV